MKFSIEAICNIGSVRKSNEDMILIGDQLIRDDAVEYTINADEKNFLIAVSDGMGGHKAGDVASQTVSQNMLMNVKALPAALDAIQLQSFLDGKIKQLHALLNNMSEADSGTYYQLGATFTGLLVYEQRTFIINIGDSRLYRLRGGILVQLTNDHSLRNLLKDSSIPPNTLTNSFGGGANDIFFDFEETSLFDNDVLLICTDGLSNEINFNQIEQILESAKPLAEMVNLALVNGGNDNISAIRIVVKR